LSDKDGSGQDKHGDQNTEPIRHEPSGMAVSSSQVLRKAGLGEVDAAASTTTGRLLRRLK
jgi:hypothetical protein